MSPSNSVEDRELERQGRRTASVSATIGFGLLTGGAIARWAARHKLFA